MDTNLFHQYRISAALGALVTTAEDLDEELARPRPTRNGPGGKADLTSPEWLALLDALSRRAEAVDRYNVATGTDAGDRIARLALMYAGDKADAARAWVRYRENCELFPMRIDDSGARACDNRALATLRRVMAEHETATGARLPLAGAVRA